GRAQAPQAASEGRDRALAPGCKRALGTPVEGFLFTGSASGRRARGKWVFCVQESGAPEAGRERMRKLTIAVALALITAAVGGSAFAQSYPSRTVTLVVPFPPGGGVDALARILAERLSVALKQ